MNVEGTDTLDGISANFRRAVKRELGSVRQKRWGG